jgi:hypothetical protein
MLAQHWKARPLSRKFPKPTTFAAEQPDRTLAVLRNERLVHDQLDVRRARRNVWRFGSGQVVYLGTVGLSFVSPVATLATHFALAGFYLLDQVRPRSTPAATDEPPGAPVDQPPP